jgi:hypothetical protein
MLKIKHLDILHTNGLISNDLMCLNCKTLPMAGFELQTAACIIMQEGL